MVFIRYFSQLVMGVGNMPLPSSLMCFRANINAALSLCNLSIQLFMTNIEVEGNELTE